MRGLRGGVAVEGADGVVLRRVLGLAAGDCIVEVPLLRGAVER
ncbi:MAG TPA: hypothetical protein VNN08_06560 [Thermoanaerobaculia bacterium]|nr:hypothetical protein [Thermoanaerobaculia bacterium]